VDLGLDVDRLVAGGIDLRSAGVDSAQGDAYFRQALVAASRIPGVASAALASGAPFTDWSFGGGFVRPGEDSLVRFDDGPYKHAVTPGWFDVSGTRLLRGRAFTESDLARGAQPVVILNEQATKILWPREEALGKCLHIDGKDKPCATVIGVAEDTHRGQVSETGTKGQAYVPFGTANASIGGYRLIVRAADGVPASRLVEPMRRMMQSLQAGLPFATVAPMADYMNQELRPWRLGATMFGVFGAIALVLAALGLFSVVAYSVAQRSHEMGVRVALGAQARDIARMVLRQGLVLAAGGVAIGVVLALAGSRFVGEMLYEVSPREPGVYMVVAVVLLLVAVAASLVPARRAMRANPLTALRAE
jgi:predicted permease